MRFVPGEAASQVIVFDGDDTLWETEPLYDRARSEAARVVAAAGFDPDDFEMLQRSIDTDNVRTMGLSAERFPTSSVEAFEELARRGGTKADQEALRRVYEASAAVFETQAPLLPYAEELLATLARSCRLALLTKGDQQVQRRRIEASGLRPYFDEIEIVSNKGRETFLDLLVRMRAIAGESWSIGNSLPSDVAPALEAGMRAIWIDAHVWAHERRQLDVDMASPGLYVAVGLRDVPEILAAALERTG